MSAAFSPSGFGERGVDAEFEFFRLQQLPPLQRGATFEALFFRQLQPLLSHLVSTGAIIIILFI